MTKPASQMTWLYWLLAVLGLIWHAMGSMNYMGQTNPEFVATMPEHYRAVIETRPAWATGAFALSVFGGVVASVLMLLRQTSCAVVFLVAAIAALITILPMIGMANAKQAIVGAGLSAIVAAVLAAYSNRALS